MGACFHCSLHSCSCSCSNKMNTEENYQLCIHTQQPWFQLYHLSLTDLGSRVFFCLKSISVDFCSGRVPVLLVSSCPSHHHHHLNMSVSGPTRVADHIETFYSQVTTVSEVVVFLLLFLLFLLFFLQPFFLDSLLLFIVIVVLLLLCS